LVSDFNKWVEPAGDGMSNTFTKTLHTLISRANRAQKECNSAIKSHMFKNAVWKLRKLKPLTKKWIKTLPGLVRYSKMIVSICQTYKLKVNKELVE
jgi:hypothetical protein